MFFEKCCASKDEFLECRLRHILQRTFCQQRFAASINVLFSLLSPLDYDPLIWMAFTCERLEHTFFYVTYACVMCSLHWNHLLLYCLCLGELCQFYFSLSYLLPQADLIPGVPRLWIGIVRPRCALHRRVSAVWQDWNWNHFLWYGLMCALYVSAPSQANNRKTQYKLSIVMEIFFFSLLRLRCRKSTPIMFAY